MGFLALLFLLLLANQYLPCIQWNTDGPWVNVVSGSLWRKNCWIHWNRQIKNFQINTSILLCHCWDRDMKNPGLPYLNLAPISHCFNIWAKPCRSLTPSDGETSNLWAQPRLDAFKPSPSSGLQLLAYSDLLTSLTNRISGEQPWSPGCWAQLALSCRESADPLR